MGNSLETLFVMDTTANPHFPKRSHEIITGMDGDIAITKSYEFTPHQRVEMPFEHAVKFLPHDAFIVTKDEEGKERFDPTPSKPSEGATIKIAPNQVIANLSELTVDALVIRSNQVAGGEKLRKQDGKDTLIAFLTEQAEANPERSHEETGEDGGDDLLGGEMSPDELTGLLDE